MRGRMHTHVKRGEKIMNENLNEETQKTNLKHRILTIVGIVLCAILTPLLVINLILVYDVSLFTPRREATTKIPFQERS